MNRMTDREAELVAEQVLNAYRQEAPVNLELIAREEGIELLEGNFGDEFEGRLEFLSDLGMFALYHPSLETAQYPGRVRFSIAHELAHYFIEAHRQGIIQGLFHDSEEGFQSLNIIEGEADRVAAALLIPAKELRSKMGRRKILTLRQILELAARCEASVQATAFRYARYAEEACLAVVASRTKPMDLVSDFLGSSKSLLALPRNVRLSLILGKYSKGRQIPACGSLNVGAVLSCGKRQCVWVPVP
jgi:hypothetical protein